MSKSDAKVHVAMGHVDITPTVAMPLAGYTKRNDNWSTVRERLEANLVLLRNSCETIVIVAIDTLFVEQGLVSAIAKRTGIPEQNLLLVASHTHNAPSLSPSTPGLGSVSDDYQAAVAEAVSQAIVAASNEDAKKANFSVNRTPAYFAVNRRKPSIIIDYSPLRLGRMIRIRKGIALSENPRGFVDSSLYIMPIYQEHRLRALIWSLAAHPAFYPERSAVSADFPGTVRRLIRERLGNDLSILYMPGLAGSVIPRIPPNFPLDIKQIIVKLLPYMQRTRSFTTKSYNKFCYEISNNILGFFASAEKVQSIDECSLRMGRDVPIYSADGGELTYVRTSALTINGVAQVVALSGEPLAEWDALIRQRPGQILTGYSAGRPIYIPTAAQVSEGGYEVEGFASPFGLNGKFIPGYEQVLRSEVLRVVAAGSANETASPS